VSPTGRTAAALAGLALLALVVPAGIVVLGAVALVAAVAVDARAARRSPALRRDVPEVLSRGVPAPLRVRGETPAGAVRLRQAVPAGLAIAPQEADGRLVARIIAVRRGRHVLPPVAARVSGPLGLARWDHRGAGPAEVHVFPDLHAARRLVLAVARGRFRDPGATARGPLGLGTEFELVRDYQPDDDIRQVNWRATARLGRPMSNQYRLEQDRDLIVLVDAGRLSAAPLGAGAGAPTVLDASLDAAAAVGLVADELGDRCGVVAFDDGIRAALSPRRAGGAVLVRTLFDLAPRPVDSDYEQAFLRAGGAKRALVLVLSDVLEEAAARPLAEAVPALARRHAVVVAASADPRLEALTQPAPAGDRLAAARAAVAGDVLAARARAAARIRAGGATFIEAPPERLPAACVAAYLRAKARARL
jgi:uncharacterized protein (DUF58 family)